MKLQELSSRQQKNMTGPSSNHDYEEIPDELTLLTPKDTTMMPKMKKHLSRLIKTQRRQEILPRKNLLSEFNKSRQSKSKSKSPNKKPASKIPTSGELRIRDMQVNADYHFARYKMFIQAAYAEKQKIARENQARSHPKPRYNPRPEANVKSGYYHPRALDRRPDLQSQRYQRYTQKTRVPTPLPDPWIKPPQERPQPVRTEYVWPKEHLLRHSKFRHQLQCPPVHQRVEPRPDCCQHIPPPGSVISMPMSLRVAKEFVEDLVNNRQNSKRSDSFSFSKF
jgi:hypothetical protein